jgi:hypothetical protein
LPLECIFRISSKESNLAQSLSKSDVFGLVSDQFEVLTYLGGGPLLTAP